MLRCDSWHKYWPFDQPFHGNVKVRWAKYQVVYITLDPRIWDLDMCDLHDHENSTLLFLLDPSPTRGLSLSSRFRVYVSPVAFSLIVIPASSPPESVTTSSLKHRERIFTHDQSHPSVSPIDIPTSRARSRWHMCIPANFLESVGAASWGMKNSLEWTNKVWSVHELTEFWG